MSSYKEVFDLDAIELRVVRVFLLAFFILICYQTIQFINVKRIDRKHNDLLVVKNQSINALQNLQITSSTIQRKLLGLALAENPAERQELETIISEAALSNDRTLDILDKAALQLGSNSQESILLLKDASNEYRVTYDAFREMVLTGDKEAALDYKNTKLRPAYESYQEIQQQLLLQITGDIISQGKKVSSYSNTSGWILFFLGLAPFIYAISKLIYLSVLLKFKSSKISIIDEDPRTRY